MIKGFLGARFGADTLEKFSCPTDFGARYGHRLRAAQKVRVVLHANVTALRLDQASGHITTVEAGQVRRLAGELLELRSREAITRHLSQLEGAY